MAISFINAGTASNAGASSLTLTCPANVQAGDVLLIGLAYFPGSTTQATMPQSSGNTFTQTPNGLATSAQNLNAQTFYRVATAADIGGTSTYVFTASPVQATFPSGAIVIYRGASIPTPVDIDAGNTGANAAPTSPSVTTTKDNDWYVTFIAQDLKTSGGTFTKPADQTQRAAVAYSSGNFDGCYLGDKALTTHGSTGTDAASYSGTNFWAAITIALAPLQLAGTSAPPAIAQVVSNFSMQPLRMPGFRSGYNSSPLVTIAAYAVGPPPIQSIIQAFVPPPIKPQGFRSGYDSSPLIAIPGAQTPPPQIQQVIQNFTPLVLIPPFPQTSQAVVVGPSPSALPITQIVAGWTQRVFPPPIYGDLGFQPFGSPTPPAPNIRQIVLNNTPYVLIPFGSSSGVAISVLSPSPAALPITGIIQAWTPRLIVPEFTVVPLPPVIPPPPLLITTPWVVAPIGGTQALSGAGVASLRGLRSRETPDLTGARGAPVAPSKGTKTH